MVIFILTLLILCFHLLSFATIRPREACDLFEGEPRTALEQLAPVSEATASSVGLISRDRLFLNFRKGNRCARRFPDGDVLLQVGDLLPDDAERVPAERQMKRRFVDGDGLKRCLRASAAWA